MQRLFPDFVCGPGAFGLLVLRLVSGAGLMMHGWPKIQNPLGWMGPDGFAPPFLQGLAALAEFGGGLALIIGLLTPIASFGILCVAATAVTMVHLANGDPFVAPRGWEGGSYETALLYFAIALLLILIGPGKISLDRLLFDKKRHMSNAGHT